MKKILGFTILSILMFVAFAVRADAATSTPTPTQASQPTKAAMDQKLNDQINQLKEKIASRVSELNLVEKRGMIGVVTEVSGSKITIDDIQGNTRFIDVDEITKFSSTSNKSFGLSDITKGVRISVLGLYNKQSKRLLARFVNTSVDPVFLNGTVSDVDSKNYFLTITTSENKQIKLDIQTTTKIFGYDKTDGLARTGFSKIANGDHIAAIGYPSKKDTTIIVPTRIITFSIASNNQKNSVPTSEPTTSPTPEK